MRTGGNNHLTHSDYLEQPRKSRRLEGRAGEIMLAARVLFERHGVAHVSVKDIAREAQITRELFYYYYPDKQAVINAVVDDFVEDLVESARVWKEQMAFENSRESLRKCIQGFRRVINNQHGPRPMFAVLDEIGRRDEFRARAVKASADALSPASVTENASHNRAESTLTHEMLCVLLFGLAGLVRINPQIDDEILVALIEQALHLREKQEPKAYAE